jgi:hypothetical protein
MRRRRGIRHLAGVDLCAMSFPVEAAPLSASHPITKSLPYLNHIIQVHLNWMAEAEKTDRAFTDNLMKLHAGLFWKAYALALNTEPSNWELDAVCAFNSLRILTTADSNAVFAMVKNHSADDVIRNNVRLEDWPPSGFIAMYFANRHILERKSRSMEGIGWPFG